MARADSPPHHPPGTQAIDRALAILTCFDHAAERGVADLAEHLDLPVSTVHRLARALVTAGLLEQDHAGGRYRLGTEAIRLGHHAAHQRNLRSVEPHLAGLARRWSATVDLAGRNRRHALVLAGSSIEKGGPILRLDLHATALGKVLLAWDRRRTTAPSPGTTLAARTPATITDPVELEDELAYVRECGYAVNDGESANGVRTVAVPVMDARGHARYALGLRSAPSVITNIRIGQVADDLRVTARLLSNELWSSATT